jgi:hypothetical protein
MNPMAVADPQSRMTGQTRLHVSATVRTHSRRPSNSSSSIRSMPTFWFGPVALLRFIAELGHHPPARRFDRICRVAQATDEGVGEGSLNWLARRDVMPLDLVVVCPSQMAFEVSSVPLSLTMVVGLP